MLTFTRGYLGWKARVTLNKLQRKRYQQTRVVRRARPGGAGARGGNHDRTQARIPGPRAARYASASAPCLHARRAALARRQRRARGAPPRAILQAMLFDQVERAAELPRRDVRPRHSGHARYAIGALTRWLAARWSWFEPRTLPVVVAPLGMVAVRARCRTTCAPPARDQTTPTATRAQPHTRHIKLVLQP